MKKVYYTPKLTVHGNLEKITQAQGNPTFRDSVFFNGQQIGNAQGSRDLRFPR